MLHNTVGATFKWRKQQTKGLTNDVMHNFLVDNGGFHVEFRIQGCPVSSVTFSPEILA